MDLSLFNGTPFQNPVRLLLLVAAVLAYFLARRRDFDPQHRARERESARLDLWAKYLMARNQREGCTEKLPDLLSAGLLAALDGTKRPTLGDFIGEILAQIVEYSPQAAKIAAVLIVLTGAIVIGLLPAEKQGAASFQHVFGLLGLVTALLLLLASRLGRLSARKPMLEGTGLTLMMLFAWLCSYWTLVK